DLARWGLRFPQSYDQILVSALLFDWRKEVDRQRQLFARWKRHLPPGLHRFLAEPLLLASESPLKAVPLSRLTLTAQLEVLAHHPEESWAECVGLNPWLNAWRDAAAKNRLGLTVWSRNAQRCLSGVVFARGFAQLIKAKSAPACSRSASVAAQDAF